MNLLEQHNQLILDKISAMPPGKEAGLAEMFGKDWKDIGSAGQRKGFGRLFKAAVSKKIYSKIEWVRIENSGRYDVYCKL